MQYLDSKKLKINLCNLWNVIRNQVFILNYSFTILKISSTFLLKYLAIFIAVNTVGKYLPVSIEFMLCLLNPHATPSLSCVIPFSALRTLILLIKEIFILIIYCNECLTKSQIFLTHAFNNLMLQNCLSLFKTVC